MYRLIFLLIIIWTEIEAYGLMIDNVFAVRQREKICRLVPLRLGKELYYIGRLLLSDHIA